MGDICCLKSYFLLLSRMTPDAKALSQPSLRVSSPLTETYCFIHYTEAIMIILENRNYCFNIVSGILIITQTKRT